MTDAQTNRSYSVFVPMVLVLVLLLSIMGTQLYERSGQRGALQELIANQQEPLQEAQRVRAQFEGLVTGTARLARNGNPNAQRVQGELQRMGINAEPDVAP
jgi:hypothetical protein